MEGVEVDVTFIDPVEGNVGPDSEVAWCEGCEVGEQLAFRDGEFAAFDRAKKLLCNGWDQNFMEVVIDEELDGSVENEGEAGSRSDFLA